MEPVCLSMHSVRIRRAQNPHKTLAHSRARAGPVSPVSLLPSLLFYDPASKIPTRGEPNLLDQVRSAIRAKHYSRRSEEAYSRWVRRFVLFDGKRHPRERGSDEVVAFLSFLAEQEPVAASTRARRLYRSREADGVGAQYRIVPHP